MNIQNNLPSISEALAKKLGNDCRETLEKMLRNRKIYVVSIKIVESKETNDGTVDGLEIEFSDGEIYRTTCCDKHIVEMNTIRAHRWIQVR